ncbi:DNA mismatch repair protein Msh3-like [Periplaneta americana]|uniref:DNA mismatch repair protein Msh3-like n=1 Tax=Periplaneta americana TaxID=6978 RepID=UPI0037E7B053
MCIAESPDTVPNSQPKSANLAIVAFDPSTGDTVYDSFEDGPCREELERRFEHLDPAEIIVPQTISQETERLVKHSSARLETLEDGVFNFTGALVQVADFFCAQEDSESNSQKLNSMSDLPPLTVVCLSALIHHLKQFGLARALRSNSLRHFTSDSRYVKMDATVLRNLEIFKSGLGTHKGSLIWALDHTRTKFGSRLLHDWVSQPVRDLAILQSRQEAITELLQSESAVVQQLEKILDGIPDIDRGLTTCIHQRIGPPSLCAVLRTLGKLQTDLESVCDFVDADLKSPLLQDLIKDALFNLSNIGPFLQNLNQQAARDGDKTKLLHDYSAFPSVMKRIDEISSVTKQLDNLKPAIARKLGLLKFDYITVSGQEFLIEVKQNQKKSVPNSWRKISETKQAIRYRSPEVDSLYREMSHLREQLINDCHSAWLLFLSDFNAHYFAHKRAIKNLATLDVLFSLVQVAKQDGYCRPTLLDSEETIIDIEKGRHPVIPLLFTSTEQFVSNNTRLKSDEECCMILSGPNMGGKSCYIRQVALIAIMAHIGSYVPAECATISILDSVFTRMGARDELFQGRSTLMLELEEASVILRRATCKSLVLLDELGRGTSSCDGTSIAIATLHHLLTEVRCLILFVTHYPAVMELENQYVGKARNYHMAFILHNKDGGSEEILTFLYEVTCGSAGRSYGLNVARLANVPQCLLQRASEKAQMLESWTVSKRCALQQFKQLWQSANLNYPSK